MTEPRRPARLSDTPTDELHPDPLAVTPPAFIPDGVPPLGEGPDPFDIESLRLPQDFSALLGLQPVLTTVAVRRPSKEWWVRVHDNPVYHFPTALISLKESGERGETYLVSPNLWRSLQEESTFAPYQLFMAITRQQEVFLWPIRLPGPDGKIDDWSKTAYQAAILAQSAWVRVQSRKQGGGYSVTRSVYTDPPQWPEVTIEDLINIAFRDRLTTTWDHPILKQLRGEA
jgi:hypothetical protein